MKKAYVFLFFFHTAFAGVSWGDELSTFVEREVIKGLLDDRGKVQYGSYADGMEHIMPVIKKVYEHLKDSGIKNDKEAWGEAYDLVGNSPPVLNSCAITKPGGINTIAEAEAQYESDVRAANGDGTAPQTSGQKPTEDDTKFDESKQYLKTSPNAPICGEGKETIQKVAIAKKEQLDKLGHPPPVVASPSSPPQAPPQPTQTIAVTDTPKNPVSQNGITPGPGEGALPQEPTATTGQKVDFSSSSAHVGAPPIKDDDSSGMVPPSQPVATSPIPFVTSSSPSENLAIVREALNQKVARGELDQPTADALIEHITPALQTEPNLIAALEKARNEMPKGGLGTLQSSDGSTSLQNLTTTDSALKPISTNQFPPDSSVGSGKIPATAYTFVPSGGVIMSSPAATQSSDKTSADMQDALAKKGAPVPDPKANLKDGNSAANPSFSDLALTAGEDLFPNKEKGGALPTLIKGSQPDGKAQIKLAVKRFINSMAAVFEPHSLAERALRGIASEGEEEGALALASLGPDHKHALAASSDSDPWISAVSFLSAFSVTLVGFGGAQLWRRKKRS